MPKIITWSFIPMIIRRFLYKLYQKRIETLDIVTRLEIELKLFSAYNFKRYGIRSAGAVKVSVFGNNVNDLYNWTLIVKETLEQKEYVPEKWKLLKFQYGFLTMDEYFSQNGFDIPPEKIMKEIIVRLDIICSELSKQNQRERTYYLRFFKPMFEDSIEVISRLRSML